MRTDRRTCIDLHVNDITYFRITHRPTRALLEVRHTTGGCLKRTYDISGSVSGDREYVTVFWGVMRRRVVRQL